MARHPGSVWLASLALVAAGCGKTSHRGDAGSVACQPTRDGALPGRCVVDGTGGQGNDAASAAGGSPGVSGDGSVASGAGGGSGGSGGVLGNGGMPPSSGGSAPGGGAGDGGAGGEGPSVEVVAEVGEVASMAADSTHLYVLVGDGRVLSVSLASGTVNELARGEPRPTMGVDGESLYFCDAVQSLSRVAKAGGDVESAAPPDQASPETTCVEAVLSGAWAYTVAYDDSSVPLLVRYDRGAFEAPEVISGVTPHWHLFAFGDFLYWGDWNDASYEFTRFSSSDESHAVVYSMTQEFSRENDALRAVDADYLYFERCSNEDQSCTLYRVPTGGGTSQPFSAHQNEPRIGYLALAGGVVYATSGARLFRFAFAGESEPLWEADDDVRNLLVQGDHLYFSVDRAIYALALE